MKKKQKTKKNKECIVWDLIIEIVYWLRVVVSKSHGWIYNSSENFDNKLLVGVEFKFLKLRW